MLLKIRCIRSCPPCSPIVLGIRECNLEEALNTEVWQVPEWRRKENEESPFLRKIVESKSGGVARRDLPISFSPYHREYGYRGVEEGICCPQIKETEHDPMKEYRIVSPMRQKTKIETRSR